MGRSRGGLSTKIHATVDAQGQPTRVCLTGGQASDLAGADVLLPDNEGRTLIADKGYDAVQRVVAPALRAGKTVVIPTIRDGRQQRNFDRSLYRLRHHIENFVARLRQWRGIATRYDKTARSFLGAIHLVCAVDWLAPFTDTPWRGVGILAASGSTVPLLLHFFKKSRFCFINSLTFTSSDDYAAR